MTVQPFAAGSYRNDRNTANLIGLKSRLDALTTQLATGKAATSYGGLGAGRSTSLSAHSAISALDGYTAAITSTSGRVTLATASLTQLAKLGSNLRLDLQNGLQSSTTAGIANTQVLARTSLEAAVDALNQRYGDDYIFSGRATDTEPVVPMTLMLDGDPGTGRAGLKDLVAAQKAADLGNSANPGWIDTSVSGSTVSLDQIGTAQTRANFGFSLLSVTSSNTSAITTPAGQQQQAAAGSVSFSIANAPVEGDRIRLTLNETDGSQRTLDLRVTANANPNAADEMPVFANAADAEAWLNGKFGTAGVASAQSTAAVGIATTFGADTPSRAGFTVTGIPVAGDTVTVTVGMRDGTSRTLQLTAAATAAAGSTTSFSIGATTADTAANIAGAIKAALGDAAATDLAASSTARAAQDFFAGSPSPGLAPRRLGTDGSGNPAYLNVASDKTVIWYRGDDSASDPRGTASVQIGANRSVAIGAQANEAPIQDTLAGLAALVVGGFTDSSGAIDIAKFKAAAERSQTALGAAGPDGDLTAVTSAFSVASSSMADAKSQAQATKVTLQNTLDGIENVSTEEVATQLLSLQTQLQASYQVTASLSKLSLVNYIS